jgi:hypothetical protein
MPLAACPPRPEGIVAAEGIPLLIDKFRLNLAGKLAEKYIDAVIHICSNRKKLVSTRVHSFMEMFAGKAP